MWLWPASSLVFSHTWTARQSMLSPCPHLYRSPCACWRKREILRFSNDDWYLPHLDLRKLQWLDLPEAPVPIQGPKELGWTRDQPHWSVTFSGSFLLWPLSGSQETKIKFFPFIKSWRKLLVSAYLVISYPFIPRELQSWLNWSRNCRRIKLYSSAQGFPS